MAKRSIGPVSERAKQALGTDDPDLVREIEILERLASGEVAHVAANGRFPHWPIDRWIQVCGFAGVIIGGLFFAGSEWSGVKRDIVIMREESAVTKADVAKLTDEAQDTKQSLRVITNEISALRYQVEQVDDVRRRVPTPSFPRSEQFSTPSFPRSDQFTR